MSRLLADNPLLAKTHLHNIGGEFFDEAYKISIDLELGRMMWHVHVLHRKLRMHAECVVEPEYLGPDSDLREWARAIIFEPLQAKLFQYMALEDTSCHTTVRAFQRSNWKQWGAAPLELPSEIDAVMLLLDWKFAARVIPQQHRVGLWVVKPGQWASAVPRSIIGQPLDIWQQYLAQVLEQNTTKPRPDPA